MIPYRFYGFLGVFTVLLPPPNSELFFFCQKNIFYVMFIVHRPLKSVFAGHQCAMTYWYFRIYFGVSRSGNIRLCSATCPDSETSSFYIFLGECSYV